MFSLSLNKAHFIFGYLKASRFVAVPVFSLWKMDGPYKESYLSFPTSVSFSPSLPVCIYSPLLASSGIVPQIPKMSSFQPTVLLWRPRRVSWHFQTTDQILPPSLLFLTRHLDARADWNQTSEDDLVLTSCCAPNNRHCQLKTDVDGDGKRQRSISSSRPTSRQELWERAQFDMRISFCKHLQQSVSGYWHPRVLLSHNFRETTFELTAQDLL